MSEVFFCAKWLNPRWQNSRWLSSSSWVRLNEFESDWIRLSQILNLAGKCEWSFFLQIVGTNLGKCEWVWEEKLRWLNPRWENSRWLPSSSWVRMNEFESDWISLSQSQSGGRVFLSESERRKQGVWIPQSKADSKMAEFRMVAIIKLGENEWVWVRLN